MEKSASEPNDSGAHDCAHRGWVKVVRNPLSPWVMLVRKPLPGWVMVVRNDSYIQARFRSCAKKPAIMVVAGSFPGSVLAQRGAAAANNGIRVRLF